MASPGDLWLIDFGDPFPGEPASRRPALIVGPAGIFGPDFPVSLVVPLTTTRRGLSIHVEVGADPATGLHTTSYAQCEQIRSVGKRRLIHHLGAVDAATWHRVDTVLRTLLGH